MESTLEKRIAVLEDIEAIKQLKATYCHLVDDGIGGDMARMDELMGLFAEDAWIDFGTAESPDVHRGRDAVTKFYKEFVCGALSYSAHIVANPLITVNGETASGRGTSSCPAPCGTRMQRSGWPGSTGRNMSRSTAGGNGNP